MLLNVLYLLLRLLLPADQAAALQRTYAPLDLEVARDHVAAARVAGAAVGVDPDLLLSIAWHESRYQADAVGPEAGGRVSCGPMTPTPVARCERATIVEGYLAGARHLREWQLATRTTRDALLGYAGGYRMMRACAKGPVLRATGRHDDLCRVPEVFLGRAAWIQLERTRRERATT
jgi:hypothetical protein